MSNNLLAIPGEDISKISYHRKIMGSSEVIVDGANYVGGNADINRTSLSKRITVYSKNALWDNDLQTAVNTTQGLQLYNSKPGYVIYDSLLNKDEQIGTSIYYAKTKATIGEPFQIYTKNNLKEKLEILFNNTNWEPTLHDSVTSANIYSKHLQVIKYEGNSILNKDDKFCSFTFKHDVINKFLKQETVEHHPDMQKVVKMVLILVEVKEFALVIYNYLQINT